MNYIRTMLASTIMFLSMMWSPASSQILETHTLSTHNDWLLRLEIYDDGSMACAARTQNRDGHVLDLTIGEDQSIVLYMFFPQVNWPNTYLTVEVHIDYASWQLHNANLYHNSISVEFPKGPDSRRFVEQLYAGRAVALKSLLGDGNTLTTWSLSGSAEILNDMWTCVSRITGLPA